MALYYQLSLDFIFLACATFHLVGPKVINLIDNSIERGAAITYLLIRKVEFLPINVNRDILVRWIKNRKRQTANNRLQRHATNRNCTRCLALCAKNVQFL